MRTLFEPFKLSLTMKKEPEVGKKEKQKTKNKKKTKKKPHSICTQTIYIDHRYNPQVLGV